MEEQKACINCLHIKTGRVHECKKKRRNKEIIDIFHNCCNKYESDGIPLVSDYSSWKKKYKG